MNTQITEILSNIEKVFSEQERFIPFNRCVSKHVGVGSIGLYVRAGINGWWDGAKWSEIVVVSNIEIDDGYRGQGLLATLLDALEDRYTCVGFEIVHNDRLAAFLRRRGYIQTKYSATCTGNPPSLVRVKDTRERQDALYFPFGDGSYGTADDPPPPSTEDECLARDERHEREAEEDFEREQERQREYENWQRQQQAEWERKQEEAWQRQQEQP